MPAATNQQIRAAFYGVEQVDLAHRATRAASDTVFDREEQRRHVITVGQTARYDTLDALVPALATHDDCATAIIGLLHLRHGVACELRLDLAALTVDLLGSAASALASIGSRASSRSSASLGSAMRPAAFKRE